MVQGIHEDVRRAVQAWAARGRDMKFVYCLWEQIEPHLLLAFSEMPDVIQNRYCAYVRPVLTYMALEAAIRKSARAWTLYISDQLDRGRMLDPIAYRQRNAKPEEKVPRNVAAVMRHRTRPYHLLDISNVNSQILLSARGLLKALEKQYTVVIPATHAPATSAARTQRPEPVVPAVAPDPNNDTAMFNLPELGYRTQLVAAGLPEAYQVVRMESESSETKMTWLKSLLSMLKPLPSHNRVIPGQEDNGAEVRMFQLWQEIQATSVDAELGVMNLGAEISACMDESATTLTSETAWKLVQYLVLHYGNTLFSEPDFLEQYILGPLRNATNKEVVPNLLAFIERSNPFIPAEHRLDLRRWLIHNFGMPPPAVQHQILSQRGCLVTTSERNKVMCPLPIAHVAWATPRKEIISAIIAAHQTLPNVKPAPFATLSDWGLRYTTTAPEAQKSTLAASPYIPSTQAAPDLATIQQHMYRAGFPMVQYTSATAAAAASGGTPMETEHQ